MAGAMTALDWEAWFSDVHWLTPYTMVREEGLASTLYPLEPLLYLLDVDR